MKPLLAIGVCICALFVGGVRAEEVTAAGAKEVLVSLSGSRREWPGTVVLKEAVMFPAIFNGKVMGNVQGRAGSAVKLVGIAEGQITVEYQGAMQRVAAASTDLVERVLAARKAAGANAGVAAAGSPTAAPSVSSGGNRTTAEKKGAVNVPPSNPDTADKMSALPLRTATIAEKAKPAPGMLPTLQSQLERAGGNRTELEKALAESRDTAAKEMALLICHASQYDLVNLTAAHLRDNVSCYQKAKREMPWASSVSEEIWLEYVLPYRVAEESLDDWRPDFAKRLAPVIASARNTKQAVLAVHKWFYEGNEGGQFTLFRPSESRDQSPRQLIDHSHEGRCYEINLAFVALLRSVGVPARVAGVPWWQGKESYHYWTEYWDTEKRDWNYIEAADKHSDYFLARDQKVAMPAVYAMPGFCKVRDPIGRECWDAMIDVSERYMTLGKLEVKCDPQMAGGPARITVYCWNLSAWRSVAGATTDTVGTATFRLGANPGAYPWLITMSAGNQVQWKTVRIAAGATVALAFGTTASDEEIVQFVKEGP